jgi:ribonuclease D
MKDVIGQLRQRRENVLLTLRHLREQQAEVDQNTEWKDLQSKHRRRALLSELTGWYDGKLQRIDRALNHVTDRYAPDRQIKVPPVTPHRR